MATPFPSDVDRSARPAMDSAASAVSAALAAAGISGTIERELPGGASTRRFFRVILRDGEAAGAAARRTLIAMYVPDPSQEIQQARQVVGGAAFVEVQHLLAEHGVPVPELISHQAKHRTLLVEDLGDATLAEHLLIHPRDAEGLYREAVSELARAQLALATLPAGSSVAQRAFDEHLLLWEIEHFRDWALEARGTHLTGTQLAVFNQAASKIAGMIGGWPRGFVHRDYQSRNLMVRPPAGRTRLTWIDFQDAMLGPRTYDLVALLMDSYQRFDREFVVDRLTEYARATQVSHQLEQLLFEFDLITVQRKLKDAGRFVFIDRKNGNSSFLKYVDSTIYRARTALGRVVPQQPQLRPLEELLEDLLGPLPATEPAYTS